MISDNSGLGRWTAVFWIVLAAASRLLPHPPNVTPLAAMALLSGARLDRRWAWVAPLAPLALSDLWLGWHSTLPFVYASFIATAILGGALKTRLIPSRLLGACLASSLLFFVVTNFGVWLTQNLYTRDMAGLAACYTAALPFLRNSLLGDMAFTGLLFGLESASFRIWSGAEAAA